MNDPAVQSAPKARQIANQAATGAISFLAFILMPAICLGVFVLASIVGIQSYEADSGHGTRGYFIAQDQSCTTAVGPGYSVYSCIWYGKFELANGRVIDPDASFDGSYPAMRAGARVPVLYIGGTAYSRHGNWTWLVALILGPLIGGSCVMWNVEVAQKAIRRIRASRARQAASATAGGNTVAGV